MTLSTCSSLLASFLVSTLFFGSPKDLSAQQTSGRQQWAALPDAPDIAPAGQAGQDSSGDSTAPAPIGQPSSGVGKQTKRILYIVPNFRAVSADVHLPPQTAKEKFKTATLDSLDYSNFIFIGIQAGIAQARSSYPEFHQGAAGYGRYYWHTFADSADENLWVEFLIPAPLHEDIRYYTLGKGNVVKRFGYAFSRIVITRADSGNETFNVAEIVGAGTAAGISNLYYPGQERTFTKTYQRWVTNVLIDGGTFVVKEFWPDVNSRIFHQKD